MGDQQDKARLRALRKMLAATEASMANQAKMWSMAAGALPGVASSVHGSSHEEMERLKSQLEAQQRQIEMIRMRMELDSSDAQGVANMPHSTACPVSLHALGVQPSMHDAVHTSSLSAAQMVNNNSNSSNPPLAASQPAKPLIQRGHAMSSHQLNQRIRQQIRAQQSKGNVVVKVEKKVRNRWRNESLASPGPSVQKGQVDRTGRGAMRRRHSTPKSAAGSSKQSLEFSAAHQAAMIMANTPGIVVAGASELSPTAELELNGDPSSFGQLREQVSNIKRENQTNNSKDTVARIAEALIGLRDAPDLQYMLGGHGQPCIQKEDKDPASA